MRYSRILIGFHFRKSVEEGTDYGRNIGKRAANLYFRTDLQAAPGLYELVASHSQKCLDVPEWSLNDGMPVVQWACNGGDNQSWRVEATSDGYSRLIAQHSGKCLDVSGESTEDRAEIIQWQCHGGENQQWRVEACHWRLSTRGPSQRQVPGCARRIHERWRIHHSMVVS